MKSHKVIDIASVIAVVLLLIIFIWLWANPIVKVQYCESAPGNGNVLHQYDLNAAYDYGAIK